MILSPITGIKIEPKFVLCPNKLHLSNEQLFEGVHCDFLSDCIKNIEKKLSTVFSFVNQSSLALTEIFGVAFELITFIDVYPLLLRISGVSFVVILFISIV